MQTVGSHLTTTMLKQSSSASRSLFLNYARHTDKSVRNIFGSVRLKGNLSRKPIRVHPPGTKILGSKIIDAQPKYNDSSSNNNTVTVTKASSVFNLTMGEVMMTNSKRLIAVEGSRLIEEALKCGLKLEKLFFSSSTKNMTPVLQPYLDMEHGRKDSQKSNPEVYRVSSKLMQTWSSVTTSPGTIGVFQKPKPTDVILRVDTLTQSIPLTVICDNIREPGNLGSILRSAAGVGCRSFLLTKGCVDCWNMKVLRGACGAHFYIPISQNEETMSIEQRILNDLDKNKQMNTEDRKIDELSESEMMPNRRMKVGFILADSDLSDTRFNVPLRNYFSVDYTSFSHIFLTIGGETEGLGKEIISLVSKLSNNESIEITRVRIPLHYNVDSLNAANAFGIIAFEIQRQLTSRKEASH